MELIQKPQYYPLELFIKRANSMPAHSMIFKSTDTYKTWGISLNDANSMVFRIAGATNSHHPINKLKLKHEFSLTRET